MPQVPPRQPRFRLLPLLALLTWGAASCGGGGAVADGEVAAPSPAATEAEWRALATPRPEPLGDAARVTVGAVEILSSPSWTLAPGAEPALVVAELAATGLLRRRDVRFVERRRFAEAAEAERRNLPRPDGAPPAGVSPGAELSASASWATLGLDSAYLELRLTDVESGDVVATRRTATANDADPVSLARTLVGAVLAELDELGRLPEWQDPETGSAPMGYRSAGVPAGAATAFARGLAAEEAWRWEAARRGYQEALARAEGFLEARAALARTARLRTGGTLGES